MVLLTWSLLLCISFRLVDNGDNDDDYKANDDCDCTIADSSFTNRIIIDCRLLFLLFCAIIPLWPLRFSTIDIVDAAAAAAPALLYSVVAITTLRISLCIFVIRLRCVCVPLNSVFGTRITQFFCRDTEIVWRVCVCRCRRCRSFYFQCPANMCKLIYIFLRVLYG